MAAASHAAARAQLVDAIVDFLSGQDLLTIADIREELTRAIDDAGPEALVALRQRLMAEVGWGYYPRDPLAQRIHHVLAERFPEKKSQLIGGEHLAPVISGPVAIFGNHLSYADANAVELVLQRGGGAAIANRLTDRRLAMDAIGLAIAGLLPESHQGVYGNMGDFADAGAVTS